MAYDLTILEEGCRELGITLDEIQKNIWLKKIKL